MVLTCFFTPIELAGYPPVGGKREAFRGKNRKTQKDLKPGKYQLKFEAARILCASSDDCKQIFCSSWNLAINPL